MFLYDEIATCLCRKLDALTGKLLPASQLSQGLLLVSTSLLKVCGPVARVAGRVRGREGDVDS